MDSQEDLKTTPEDGHLNFLDLPPELLLKVCDYLDSSTVINILSKVCIFFHDLATNDLIWKTRIHKRWPGKRYPAIAAEDYFDWKAACIEREVEYKKWTNPAKHMQRTDINFGFCIDIVHITQADFLILGLRDHSLYSYKICDIPGKEKTGDNQVESDADITARDSHPLHVNEIRDKQAFKENAHAGWIWTVSSNESRLCSGGWDSKVKLWEYSGKEISAYRCGSAVLCSDMVGDEILAGTFNRTLMKIDTRCKEPVASARIPTKAVLCIQQTGKWIITGSESKIINIIDRNTLKICNTEKLSAGYPRSMSLEGNLMYIGTNSGAVHLYSFSEQLGRLTYIETFEGSHQKEVRSIRQTFGSVLTASKDGICKIWEPSGTPAVMQTISSSRENDEICSMDYRNNKMVMGTGSGDVSLFRHITPDADH